MQQSLHRSQCCQEPPANRWPLLTAFPLKILDNVSSIGSGAGIAESSRRGSTSKGTKVSDLYKYFKYIFLTIPLIFGSPPPRIRYLRASWNTLTNFAQKCSCCGNHTTAARLVVQRRLCSPVRIFTTAINQMRGHWSTSSCGYSGCVVFRHFSTTTLRATSRTADLVTFQATSCHTSDSLRIGIDDNTKGGGGGLVGVVYQAIIQRILGKPTL
jgi:hypothetical protein